MGFSGYWALQCDSTLPFGWYRFRGAAGTEMPTSCVGTNRCGTHAPGWLNGSHPSVADGAVHATVCLSWVWGCCSWSTSIRVRNCSGFYVYELGPTPGCHLRYCGNGGGEGTKANKICRQTGFVKLHIIRTLQAYSMSVKIICNLNVINAVKHEVQLLVIYILICLFPQRVIQRPVSQVQHLYHPRQVSSPCYQFVFLVHTDTSRSQKD